eukprot:2608295-Pleurochrysis_carterae.AAC.2
MRRELRSVTETLAAYRLAQAGAWRQLFTDGTGRRQTPLLTTIIGIDGAYGKLVLIIVRAGFVAESESSEQHPGGRHLGEGHSPSGAQASAPARRARGALPRRRPQDPQRRRHAHQ